MDKYVIEKVIGEGTYGVVYKAIEKGTQDRVAIKKFKTTADEQLSKREIQACSMLSHPYIVSYRNSFRHDGLLHLVFDFVCEGMTRLLAKNKRGIKPHLAQKFTYQLCQALHYCHANQVIHRDVKPDNILIDERGDIKLCDFGNMARCSRCTKCVHYEHLLSVLGVARLIQFHGDPLSDYVATRWYRPPEQELRMDRYTFNADVWSVGCVLVELLTGRPLFPGNTQIDQLNLIQNVLGPLPQALLPRLPRGVTPVQSSTRPLSEVLAGFDLLDGTLDFLAKTLQLDAKTRLSAADCLAHPFLRGLRDAEAQARRDRQLEEKRRCSNLHDDDGIEEDIPGEKATRPLSPISRPKPSAKASIDQSKTSAALELRGVHDESMVASPKKRSGVGHQEFSGNNTECDSDDIQELIEEDEGLAIHPHRASGCKQGSSPTPRSKASRRRTASGTKGHRDGDPVDRDSCYEDDFED